MRPSPSSTITTPSTRARGAKQPPRTRAHACGNHIFTHIHSLASHIDRAHVTRETSRASVDRDTRLGPRPEPRRASTARDARHARGRRGVAGFGGVTREGDTFTIHDSSKPIDESRLIPSPSRPPRSTSGAFPTPSRDARRSRAGDRPSDRREVRVVFARDVSPDDASFDARDGGDDDDGAERRFKVQRCHLFPRASNDDDATGRR